MEKTANMKKYQFSAWYMAYYTNTDGYSAFCRYKIPFELYMSWFWKNSKNRKVQTGNRLRTVPIDPPSTPYHSRMKISGATKFYFSRCGPPFGFLAAHWLRQSGEVGRWELPYPHFWSFFFSSPIFFTEFDSSPNEVLERWTGMILERFAPKNMVWL